MSSTDIVNGLVKKSNAKLKFLYRYSKLLNKATRKILCLALIQGHLDYACMSWFYNTNTTLQSKLQIIQNKMARFILDLGPRDHVGHHELRKCGILNVKERVTQLSLNIVYNVFYGNCPAYFNSYYSKASQSHSHDTRFSFFNFCVPKINSITAKTFYYNAIKQWNNLPDHIRSSQTKIVFKSKIKKHLIKRSLDRENGLYVM